MPYHWRAPTDSTTPAQLRLWPYRSLPRRGFVGFIGVTCALLLLPLLSQLGTPGLWVLLPFLAVTVAGLWIALKHSYKTGTLTEELSLSHGNMTLIRRNPGGDQQSWTANPYWVRVSLDRNGGPVPNYLTLIGAGREVELGAFLTPDERQQLYGQLLAQLGDLARQVPPI